VEKIGWRLSTHLLATKRPARGADVVYCASSGRSALAADALQQLGHTNVAHLDGGFNAWKAAGKPT